MGLQRLGGCAAIAAVCGGIAYLILSVLTLNQLGDGADLVKVMAAVSAAPFNFYVLNLLTIIVYTLLLIMFFALCERLRANAPHLARMTLIAVSAGTAMNIVEQLIYLKSAGVLIPAQDLSAYRACITVASGIGYMGLHGYGWACLLAGFAILKTRAFSLVLGWMLLLAGVFAIPAFALPQSLSSYSADSLHLLGLASAAWIGVVFLRQPRSCSNQGTGGILV